MAIGTPEFLQVKTYTAKAVRAALLDLGGFVRSGIVQKGDLAVTQRGTGANMSVDVATGSAWVKGLTSSRQGLYHIYNDAVVNLPIASNSSGNPRIDTIGVRIYDSIDGAAGSDQATVEVFQGTPTVAATLASMLGASALPNTVLPLAFVLVANGAASITNSVIGGYYMPWNTGLGAVAGAPPQYALGRPAAYIPGASARLTSNVGVATGVSQVVALGTDLFNNDGMHSTVTNNSRIIVQTPGVYTTYGAADWAVSNGQRIRVLLRINGVTNIGDAAAVAGSQFNNNVNCVVPPRAFGYGDYMENLTDQLSGVTATLSGNDTTYLSMIWVGP